MTTLGLTSSRYYVPALAKIYAALDAYMLPLLRASLGAILIPHGCQKLFGWFGGMGFTRFAALFDQIGYRPGAFWVTVVIFMINAVWFTSAKGFFWTAGGSEFSILLLVVALVFLIKGGGNLSVDERMSKEL